jgi:hypothetical protein
MWNTNVDVQKFDLKTLNDAEVEEKHMVKVSSGSSALENLEYSGYFNMTLKCWKEYDTFICMTPFLSPSNLRTCLPPRSFLMLSLFADDLVIYYYSFDGL